MLLKWTSLLALFCGLGLIAWAGFAFGRSYLEARAGQSDLRSEFSVSGNGAVDPGYLRQQAAAMQARLQKLDPVGEIGIPGIGANWMIAEGSDEDAFAKGPGHIEDTPLPGAGGNFVVAGDRVLYGAPFLKLNELQAGDLIEVKMPYAIFVYRVSESFIVIPDDVSVLEPVGYEAITLITCDPPWDVKQRIVVRGKLDHVQPAGVNF
jgi:sortase A